jgi:GH15 family glucan-1,4-alpha-glucosidase
MPVHWETVHRHAELGPAPRLVRLVQCLGGEVVLRNSMQPRPDYARAPAHTITVHDHRMHGDTGDLHLCIVCTQPIEAATSEITVTTGDALAYLLMTSPSGECPAEDWSVDEARRLLRETQEYWWRWAGRISYRGPYTQPVERSALALKLMTYAPTGAIIAAPTTSLPEQIGGPRNWDYRFTWLRDASFTLYAFFQLGLIAEAESFFHWLTRLRLGPPGSQPDNLYRVDGGRVEGEIALDHLRGYRGSAPVRIGNAAAQQLQLDVYGEALDSVYLYARYGGHISEELWARVAAVVELAIANWQLPDRSIWEVRGEPQHFTYSKMMCWVAVDRGLRIAARHKLPHDSARWRAARRDIQRRVIEQGWNPKLGAFTMTLGGDTLDAAILRMAQVRFLEDDDPRLRSTVETIGRRLGAQQLVMRYRVDEIDDGLDGDEGAFLTCSFWLADAYAHMGELEEAQRLFEHLLCFAAPLGLLSEEAEPATGELLGNYPQAFTHLSLVGAAVNIERARHRLLGARGVRPERSAPRARAVDAPRPSRGPRPVPGRDQAG